MPFHTNESITVYIPEGVDVIEIAKAVGTHPDRIALLLNFFYSMLANGHISDTADYVQLSNKTARRLCRVPVEALAELERRGIIEVARNQNGNKSYRRAQSKSKMDGRSSRYRLHPRFQNSLAEHTLTDPAATNAYQRVVLDRTRKTNSADDGPLQMKLRAVWDRTVRHNPSITNKPKELTIDNHVKIDNSYDARSTTRAVESLLSTAGTLPAQKLDSLSVPQGGSLLLVSSSFQLPTNYQDAFEVLQGYVHNHLTRAETQHVLDLLDRDKRGDPRASEWWREVHDEADWQPIQMVGDD